MSRGVHKSDPPLARVCNSCISHQLVPHRPTDQRRLALYLVALRDALAVGAQGAGVAVHKVGDLPWLLVRCAEV